MERISALPLYGKELASIIMYKVALVIVPEDLMKFLTKMTVHV